MSFRLSIGVNTSCPSFPEVMLESAASLKLNGGDSEDCGIWEEEAMDK